MSHSLGLNFLIFRDAGPKCPVDNEHLDEWQVIIIIVIFIIVSVVYQYIRTQ